MKTNTDEVSNGLATKYKSVKELNSTQQLTQKEKHSIFNYSYENLTFSHGREIQPAEGRPFLQIRIQRKNEKSGVLLSNYNFVFLFKSWHSQNRFISCERSLQPTIRSM